MSVTLPLTTLFSDHVLKTAQFKLMSRGEFSRQEGGRLISVSRHPAVWLATFTSTALSYDDAVDLEALLSTLDGSVHAFEAHDTRRPYPKNYPTGSFSDTGIINSINVNNKAMTISGLPANFVITRGDKLSFAHVAGGLSLHYAVESVTADGAGLTPEFEVRPHIPSSTTTSTPVVFKKPPCYMLVIPDTVEYSEGASTLGVVTFEAVQMI